MEKPPFLSDSPQFSVFYLGGPLDGQCLTRSFREALQVGHILGQILSIEGSSHQRWIQTGEAGPTIVRAEYEIMHINGAVVVAKFIGNNEQRFYNLPPQGPQD